jgi:hypothetical protein
MNDQSVNLAHKDCLRSVSNIGETIVRNICDGSSTVVPWGTLDWAGAVGGAAGIVAFITFFACMSYVVVKDYVIIKGR